MNKTGLLIAVSALTTNAAIADLHLEAEPIPHNFYSTGLQHQSESMADYAQYRPTNNGSGQPQSQSQGFGSPTSTTVAIQFDNRSSTFRPSPNEESILADAANAALVTVRGRTSTPTPSTKDEALSLSRALSARKYLIDHGVSPLKISINFASAADFIADNSTLEGRMTNQRVEIELVYVSPTN